MDKTKVTKDLAAKTLTIERTFDAPVDKVWRAYAEKDLFVQWWGPEGWNTTVKEYDFRTGGRAHYCMKCVDENQGEFFGQESWGLMEYKDVEQPRFTYVDFFSDVEGNKQGDMPTITVHIELIDDGAGHTAVVSRCVGESAEDIEKLVEMGMIEGYSSSCNKLENVLSQL